jgi:hypothetical protein
MFADKNTTARRLINAFRAFFMDTGGAPVKIYADNSPFGAAELQSFLRDWGVSFGSSSPPLSPIQRQGGSGHKIYEKARHRLQNRGPTGSGQAGKGHFAV